MKKTKLNKKLTYSERGKLGSKHWVEKRIQNIKNYEKNPKKCKFCNSILAYDKRFNNFCNHSCSAKLRNVRRGYKNLNRYAKCKFCNKLLLQKFQIKFCSKKCFSAYIESKKVPIETLTARASIRRRIIKDKLIPYECNYCKLTTWQNKEISLQIHHINGMSNDHRLENIILLCPNCHSQTENFSGKNVKKNTTPSSSG